MPVEIDFPKYREIEYAQICETYRQRVRTLFDTFKFFILFQGGLGTLAGAIFSKEEFNSLNWWGYELPISFPLFVISLIGCSTAFVAPFIARGLYRYHDTLVARARTIESQYGMRQISDLGDVWSEAGSYRSATSIALLVFAIIAVPWFVGIVVSINP
jgi:hypothetical protein